MIPKAIEDLTPILKKYGLKRGKVEDIFEFKSMDEWAEMERIWKEKHPILNFLRSLYYKLCRLWSDKIAMIPKRIKWFFQRGLRGYSDCDLWSFDYFLAEVISKGCKDLAETTNCYPLESSLEEWNKTLKEISKEFEDYINFFKEEGDKPTNEEYNIKLDRMFNLLRKNFGNLWD